MDYQNLVSDPTQAETSHTQGSHMVSDSTVSDALLAQVWQILSLRIVNYKLNQRLEQVNFRLALT